MPNFPVVDAHLHIWNPERIRIGWQEGNAFMQRPRLPQDYLHDLGDLEVEAAVFVECFVDQGEYLKEVRFVEENMGAGSPIRAIVAQAPVELGADMGPFIEHLKSKHPDVVGIRRMIEFNPDEDFCLRPGFVEGVNLLGEAGLSFDINIHHSQAGKAAEMVAQVPDTVMILDHCGKPGIAEGEIGAWRSHLKTMAANPNLHCKLSDLPVEADHDNWTEDDLKPYIDAVVEIFGFDRLIYAGDWPVCTQATTLPRWVEVLDRHFSGVSETDLRRFYRGNANRVYKLGLPE
ncbi:amidohydrolase family protein [Oceaniglobus trochenteri]|uniref:amidohydrolase family protein n=1 Tax=Oceaniglobus trochenteri TaxID=2763260 RepID=UPI001CFF7473|nr:amidohydrolase family protein [Oceaniglobus trochenteri]